MGEGRLTRMSCHASAKRRDGGMDVSGKSKKGSFVASSGLRLMLEPVSPQIGSYSLHCVDVMLLIWLPGLSQLKTSRDAGGDEVSE